MQIWGRVRTSERKSTVHVLSKLDMLSVNQIAAQIKLTEMWKVVKSLYPLKVQMKEINENWTTTWTTKKS